MSDTIQMRHYTAEQAVLLQQRPMDLMKTHANEMESFTGLFSRTVQAVYEHSTHHLASEGIVSAGGTSRDLLTALASGVKVMLPSNAWPTTALEQFVHPDKHQSENCWMLWVGEAKQALQKGASKGRNTSTAAARLRVERLTALEAAFGFTIQDLAVVLGITRPQLYKWLDASNDIKLQEASRARLAMVERIAKEWTSRSMAPLSSISKEPLNVGGNVFAMLTADTLNEAAVIAAFDELMAKLQAKPKTRSQRLRELGFTRRPSVRSLPSDE